MIPGQPDQPVTGSIGLLSAVPLYVEQELLVESVFVRAGPWQPPSLTGLRGRSLKNPSERILIVSDEVPYPLLVQTTLAGKRGRERLHLDRYRTDFYLGTGKSPFGAVREGSDPPDFVASRESDTLRVDCTQFAVEERREAHALFEKLRKAILDSDRDRFEHLRGLFLFLWFGDPPQAPQLPPKRGSRTRIEALLKSLEAYKYDPSKGTAPFGWGMPQRAPDLGIQDVPEGNFCATPILGASPLSLFFCSTGFELGLAYTTTHSTSSVWKEIQRLVTKHDQSEVDCLLITVGGPNRWGLVYPSELALLDLLLLTGKLPALTVSHLKNVTFHSWETGRILQLFPEAKHICPGGFGAAIPAHHVLVRRV